MKKIFFALVSLLALFLQSAGGGVVGPRIVARYKLWDECTPPSPDCVFASGACSMIKEDEYVTFYISASPTSILEPPSCDDEIRRVIGANTYTFFSYFSQLRALEVPDVPLGNNCFYFEAYNGQGGGGISTMYLLKIAKPGWIGFHPYASCRNTPDPIDVINGSMHFDLTDLHIPCPGFPLVFTRSYNSGNSVTGVLGRGWSHSYEVTLTQTNSSGYAPTNHWTVLGMPTGEAYAFYDTVTNGTLAPYGTALSLATNGSKPVVTFPYGVACTFNTNGALETISNLWGNVVTLTYTNGYQSNLLTRIQHSNGQRFDLTYVSNRLAQVSTTTNLSMSFAYDAAGMLIGATNVFGTNTSVSTYSYSNTSLGQLLMARTDATGTVHSCAYDPASGYATNLFVGADYYRHLVNYTSTPLGTSTVTYVRGTTNLAYDYLFDPVSENVTNIYGPASGGARPFTTFDRDPDGDLLSETMTEGDKYIQTSGKYDDYHNPTNIGVGYCAAPQNYHALTWNTNYQTLTSITDPEGAKIELEYTNCVVGKIKTYYSPTATYDSIVCYTTNGLLSSVTNANGHWANLLYGANGFPTSFIPQLGPVVNLEFNDIGHLRKIITPWESGQTRTSWLLADELGRVTNVIFADGLMNVIAYDKLGNPTNIVDWADRTTRLTYLPTRKLSSVTRTLVGVTNQDITTSATYDNQFNTFAITDAKGRAVETYMLDSQDRVSAVTNLEAQTMSVTYKIGDFINTITRFDGTVVSNDFNSDGLVSVVTYPDSTDRFSYLKNGLLRTASNETCVVSNTWDYANRLTNTAVVSTACPASSVSYTYFPAGQVSNVVSIAGTSIYALDAADRLSSIQSPASSFLFSYNTNSGLVSCMLTSNTAAGLGVSYGFDMMDRITNIVWRDSSSNIVRSFRYQYSAADMIANVTREDGSVLEYGYDSLDRLISEKKTLAGATVYEQTFGYDAVGNRTNRTQGSATVNYGYSSGCDRLTAWGATSTNNFNDFNPVEVSVLGSSTEAIGTNAALGQLCVSNYAGGAGITPSVSGTNFSGSLPITPTGGTYTVCAAIGDEAGNVGYATNTASVCVVTNTSYSYSDAGCITDIAQSGSGFTQTLSLVWNGQYQITEAKTNGYSVEKYGFDAYGRRAWTAQGTVTNFHVYDGVHCIADLNSTGGLVRTYTYGPGIDNLLAMTVYTGATAVTYFPLTDHLGTVHALADETGSIVESYQFDAWGRVLGVYNGSGIPLTESTVGNRILWQGREYSWNTSLYFFRARWYDPITGRWLSNDPIGISGGLNQYVFCGNCPTMYRDPFGLYKDGGSGLMGWYQGGNSTRNLVPTIASSVPMPTSNELWRECEGLKPGESLYDAALRFENEHMGGHGQYGGGYAHAVFFGLMRREYGGIPAWGAVAGYNTLVEREYGPLAPSIDLSQATDRIADWIGYEYSAMYPEHPVSEVMLLVYPSLR